MPRKNISINPYLSEYVYDLLWNITPEDKKKLSRRYWPLLTSSVRARNFADFSTMEEKMGLFSELGIDYAIVFSQERIKNAIALKRVMKLYEEDKKAGAIKEISKLKVFVSSDREVSFLLSLMSQNIHYKSYFLNQEMNKVSYHLKQWDKKEISPEGQEFREIIEGCDIVDKTLLNCCINFELTNGILGINQYDMKVLLYLNQFKHIYIDKDAIFDYFAGYTNKRKITSSVKRLSSNNFIKRHQDLSDGLKYTITTTGINTVGSFRSLVLKANQF